MPEFTKSLFSFGAFKTQPPPSSSQAPGSSAMQPPYHRDKPISAVTQSNAAPTFQTAHESASAALSFSSFNSQGPSSGTSTARPSQVESNGSQSSASTVDADSQAAAGVIPVVDTTTFRPMGKLKVRIIEARNLLAASESSCPYVVCTFDTSEFISHGPAGAAAKSEAPVHPTGIAIPSKSRQSSSLHLSKLANGFTSGASAARNPMWKDEAQFDVTSHESELDISIYDSKDNDRFLGHARVRPDFSSKKVVDKWVNLEPRISGERVSGEVRVSIFYEKVSKRQYGPQDFDVLRLVGKGTFGQVYQVRKKDTHRIYAMKVLSKKAIVQKKEIAHTIGERNILVRTSSAESAFIVGLKLSFQTPTDLYLVTDYMSGGELFWHLQREGRFNEQRAKFYIAELIVALEHLHDNDIIYRDLKPENILLDANGHIALCDFGLSKANINDGTTNTFCGTTEYLAPEVLLDEQGYTKMVDFWSLGVLVFEMCCGWSPFYAEDNQQMYKNIAFGKVKFPKDALSPEGRNFVKGLLNRNPKHRLGSVDDARELRRHPFFNDIDWDLLIAKKLPPPFKPQVSSETDTSNFDPEFTQTSTSVLHKAFMPVSSTPLSPGIQANFQGFTYVNDSSLDENFRARLGTSFKPKSHIAHDDDIDLYDDKDIQISQSYFNESDLMARGAAATRVEAHGGHGDVPDADGDIGMMEDDEHDFVNGQGFEM